MKGERLDKVLSVIGLGTRKTVRPLVWRGRVTVNGLVADNPDQKVVPGVDDIALDGKTLTVRTSICLMMNKPQGYVCSSKDGNHPTVFELLPETLPRTYLDGELCMVGRLDVDTEGLLVFTSDGVLNHRLSSPKHHVPKVYRAELRDAVPAEERERYGRELSAGIHIAAEGREEAWDCLPARIVWSGGSGKTVCEVTVREGKYHEIKRMFAALGNEVVRLTRVRMGGLALDPSLPPGAVRELSPAEVESLSSAE